MRCFVSLWEKRTNVADFTNSAETEKQAEFFFNRLQKRFKHLNKWAKRTNTGCFRVYDKDIPEIPLSVDIFNSVDNDGQRGTYAHICLYERPYEKDVTEEQYWLEVMQKTASKALDIPPERIFLKTKKKQRGESAQYEKFAENHFSITVEEAGIHFKINLTDYLDTGLFFDHRPLRALIRQTCTGKSVLNLFCYTGSFSCYAAAGNAKSVDSVDLSNTYLQWAKDNFKLNGFSTSNCNFIQSDAVSFIESAIKSHKKWDIIVLDPPTFSNSKRMSNIFDINRSWSELVNNCLKLLSPNGILYFSTNSRKLKFDSSLIEGTSQDITASTIPEDFRNTRIHRCWKICNP